MTQCNHNYQESGYCEWVKSGKTRKQVIEECTKCGDVKEGEVK